MQLDIVHLRQDLLGETQAQHVTRLVLTDAPRAQIKQLIRVELAHREIHDGPGGDAGEPGSELHTGARDSLPAGRRKRIPGVPEEENAGAGTRGRRGG